jgi:hypothetical protein
MFTKHIEKKDGKTGEVLWSGDVELPGHGKDTKDYNAAVAECIKVFGAKDVYDTFLAKKVIQIQAENDPRKATSLLPRSTLTEIRGAIDKGDVTLEELQAYIKAKRAKKWGDAMSHEKKKELKRVIERAAERLGMTTDDFVQALIDFIKERAKFKERAKK